jgi:signal transduction histidine kinase/ActR/RegA family two-component response regulator
VADAYWIPNRGFRKVQNGPISRVLELFAPTRTLVNTQAKLNALAASLPPDRRKVLDSYCILDTPQEQIFEDIVQLATDITGCSVAAVSLIDADRQWFKARRGLATSETSLSCSLCVVAIQSPGDLLVIEDTYLDPRSNKNEAVTCADPLRFYMGAPLVTSNRDVLGTLCVADKLPRRPTEAQCSAIRMLARQTATLIEWRRNNAALRAEMAERQAAEAALARQNEFTNALLNSLAEGIVACDGDGKISIFNGATRHFHGLPATPIPAEEWAQYYNLYRADGITPLETREIPLFRALSGAKVENDEIVIAPRNLPARILQCTGQPIRGNSGELLGAVVAMRDVTEGKRVERELVEARKRAEQASQEKSQFLANMSHEIRTPMNGVMGFAQLLLHANLGPKEREYAAAIHQSCKALLTVINDILDLSKVEAGKLELETAPFSLSELLKLALTTVSPAARAKGLEVRLQVAPAVPEIVAGDGVRLHQVLLNLLGNAVKFTPSGSIELRAEVTQRESARAVVQFEIADTGIGIEQSKIDSIFRPFTQADSSTTRKFGGTGLGLAISEQLVRLMGGRISVSSKVGVGSTFRFAIPLDCPALVSAPEPGLVSSVPSSSRQLHILLADDDPTNQLLGLAVLKSCGHRVTVAANGIEALSRHESEAFDLILMDVHMPELDGLSAAREIRHRERKTSRRTPILALTASAYSEDHRACMSAGMDDFLPKPLDLARFVSVVDRLTKSQIGGA